VPPSDSEDPRDAPLDLEDPDNEYLKRFNQLYSSIYHTILSDREINENVPPRGDPHALQHPLSSERLGKKPDLNLVHEVAFLLATYVWSCERHGVKRELRLFPRESESEAQRVGLNFFLEMRWFSLPYEGGESGQKLPRPKLLLPMVKAGPQGKKAKEVRETGTEVREMGTDAFEFRAEAANLLASFKRRSKNLRVAPKTAEQVQAQVKNSHARALRVLRRAEPRWMTQKLMFDLEELLGRKPHVLADDRRRRVGRLLQIVGALKPTSWEGLANLIRQRLFTAKARSKEDGRSSKKRSRSSEKSPKNHSKS